MQFNLRKVETKKSVHFGLILMICAISIAEGAAIKDWAFLVLAVVCEVY